MVSNRKRGQGAPWTVATSEDEVNYFGDKIFQTVIDANIKQL
jgi:hypothetical protein